VGEPEYRYENALKWIRTVAGMHYWGGAFDPEHMRSIANIAGDALAGRRDLPDHDEAMAASQERAVERAAKLGFNLSGPDEDGDTDG